MKSGLYLMVGVLLFLGIILAGCVEPNDDDGRTLTPTITASPPSASDDAWVTVSPQALFAKEESREALNRAADDVQQGDTGWLVAAMPPELQEMFGERPAISTADADEIARALTDAKEVEMHENLIIYETTYRGKTHSFYSVREWKGWKIVGF